MKQMLFLISILASASAFAACPSSALEQARQYKQAIGTALAMSEGDSEWSVFCSASTVDAEYSADLVAKALKTKGAPVSILSADDALEFLDEYITNNPYESQVEADQYAAFKTLILRDFTEIRAIKVGETDSGEMKFYIFGRTADGYLVGLKTVLIET